MGEKKSISFLLFGAGDCPGGGIKMILEYANRFTERGYDVHIVYPASLNWLKGSILYKLKCIYIYIKRLLFIGYSSRSWFNLNKKVHEHWTLSLNYRHIPKTDIYIATEVRTAPYLNDYPINSTRKFYFIQGYENWFVSDEFCRKTYNYDMSKIVITNWLQRIITHEEHEQCVIVPNGFDFSYFQNYNPIEKRDKYCISMLYHTSKRKGIEISLHALDIVKGKYPQIKVLIFGTNPRPDFLPDWYEYYQKPDKEAHNKINNTAAIYIGASPIEGFGLTVGEAMLCGQAVACTNNDGYMEMAKDGHTALLSPIGDPVSLADNIIKLIEDDELRKRLAISGEDYIHKHFDWEKSTQLFLDTLNSTN